MTGEQGFLLGLTGSIGMGKTTTAGLFAQEGIPVWDADAAVHRLYGQNGAAVPLIAGIVPDAVVDGAVDRKVLRQAILDDAGILGSVEKAVHPLVAEDRKAFIARHPNQLVILDIPLLFETGGEKQCDAIVVVSAPPDVQEARVLERPGMTRDAFQAILARQTPDTEKRARADYVIDTSRGVEDARQQVQSVIRSIREGNHA